MGITFNNPLNNIALVFLLGGFSVGAEAANIGSPAYYLRTWGISPDATNHPLADSDGSNSTSLGFASHADAVNGQVTLTNDNDRIFVQAGVVNDGDTFAVSAYSARNYRAEVIYSGSAADVMVLQSYTKDAAEAKLTYTYTYAFGNGFVNPESGPGCPIGVTYCLNAGLFSTVNLYDSNDVKIWSDSDFMQINQSGPGGSRFFRADTGGDWPWVTTFQNPGYSAGSINIESQIPGPVTSQIDLSGIELNEEFTVEYHLYGYAYDLGSYLGLNRGTGVTAKDPLGGDTGVSFDIVGLTPTNNPYIPAPVPVPGAFWLFTSGILVILGQKRRNI